MRDTMSSIRFFHCADLHLDSPFKGMSDLPSHAFKRLRNSTFDAFQQLINDAIQERPDFILIVGDLYDGEERSLRAQQIFQKGMEQLALYNIPVIISYGNHDHLSGKWTRFSLPSNVQAMPAETKTITLHIRGMNVNITGFSYRERHIPQAMVQSYPVATDREAIHIGMLHGSIRGDATHDVYAPFTIEDLLSKQYDYWALGHIHKRQILHENPMIVYPGNIQSRHRKELGVKGFYDIELSKGQATYNFRPASAVVFEEIEVDCEKILHANDLLKVCAEAIEGFRKEYGAGLVWLHLKNIDERARTLFEDTQLAEWVDIMREEQENETPLVWIQAIAVDLSSISHYKPTFASESVLQAINEWSDDEMREILKELYQHPKAGRYLDELTSEDLKNLRFDAEHLFKLGFQ